MTQEKKESLTVLLIGTSAIVAMWIIWLVTILFPQDSREFGMGMLLLLPAICGTLIGGSAVIATIKILLSKDEERKD